MKAIIERTAKNEQLERKYYCCQNEVIASDSRELAEERSKTNLILALEDSRSFARTYKIIANMEKIKSWTTKETESIIKIALDNSQVRYVANADQLKPFFYQLMGSQKSALTNQLKKILD
nr:hypothetical protein [Liquorilactobacillus sicerae]